MTMKIRLQNSSRKLNVLRAVLCGALIMAQVMPTVPAKAVGKNLIKNPNFATADSLNEWTVDSGAAFVTAKEQDEVIFDVIKCYGEIAGRTSNYECFSQDVTDKVKNGETYEYTFYAKLNEEDYAGKEADLRKVEISPYITVEGHTTYSQGLEGEVSKVLEPGEWTKFTGTYTPSWEGKADRIVIRILEQGKDYGQSEGVKGTYYLTGVSLKAKDADKASLKIEEDAVNFKDAVCDIIGDDFIVGTAICNSDLADVNEMALVHKHFNAITTGNELKPDAMFGYSNDRCPGTETVTLNGSELVVPKMDYSRAEKTLDHIYDWNAEHPDQKIMVRGHVLVWHSQTPEWWFHEDYDASKPYADTETMNRRMEWYIKTMAEHFTGKDSKYRGMFYGWDVVNEAVSDGSGTYRNDRENSNWWKVYQSNEFIIDAFRFANKYMDPSVDLFYNDYGECSPKKREGIVKLLKDVKEAEGTRIDGVGMQGHYQTESNPSIEDFEASARAFAEVVDQIQITEFDLSASGAYDGTDVTKDAEFATQAYRYKAFFDKIRELKAEGIPFTNITFWGVVDKFSWLQTFNTVGGATDGTRKQCPLLFDDDYQIKPAFWAFADDSKLTPVSRVINFVRSPGGGSMKGATTSTFSAAGADVTIKPVWCDDYLLLKLTVLDAEINDTDKVVIYASGDGKEIVKKEVARADAIYLALKGYEANAKVEMDPEFMQENGEILFDIVVYNDKNVGAYSDQTLSQETDTQYYAKVILSPNPEIKATDDKDSKNGKDSDKDSKNGNKSKEDKEEPSVDNSSESEKSVDKNEVEYKPDHDAWRQGIIAMVVVLLMTSIFGIFSQRQPSSHKKK